MSNIPQMPHIDYLVAQGLVFRIELGYSGVGAGSYAYTGVTTGNQEVVVLQRSFGSSESVLTAELFEASFSGGTAPNTGGTSPRLFNRRLSSTEPAPATVLQGVTPGALGNAITAATLRAGSTTGSASLQVSGDESRIYLKANTSYVIRYTNGGAGAASIGNSIDFRKVLKGPWDRAIESA